MTLIKELSQAEVKRRRIQKSNLEMKLAKMLRDFENKFMTASTNYHWDQLEDLEEELMIVDAESREAAAEKYTDVLTRRDLGQKAPYDNGRYGNSYQRFSDSQREEWLNTPVSKWTIMGEWDKLNAARIMIGRESLTKFKFMTEANAGWVQRFDKLVLRVLSEAKSTEKMTLSTARAAGSELEILIQQETQEFHCRFIWVDGQLVAPHHRFIVTTRKIK
jgi:hypothetical protein